MSISIFFCYAHEDEPLLNKLKAHLTPLQRQGLIATWYDRDISAGSEWEQVIKEQLNSAQIILLLVSADFMASDFVNNVELKRAIERHNRGEARVIPIILRHVYWQGVLGKLQSLPKDAKPVTSWPDPDEAFFNVAEGIRKVVEDELAKQPPPVGTMLLVYNDHTGQVRTLTWSPDSKRLASASGKLVNVWEATTGKTILVYQGHSTDVDSVAWSPDGNRVASRSGSFNTIIQVWDARDGYAVLNLRDNKSLRPAFDDKFSNFFASALPIQCSHIAWSPNGTRIASSERSRVCVWDAANGNQVATLDRTELHAPVSWSPDGKRIVTVQSTVENPSLLNEGDSIIWVFDAFSGTPIFQCGGNSRRIYTVVWSPDGTRIASRDADEKVLVWDAITGRNILTYHGHSEFVRALAWSPDSKYLASGNASTVHIWDVATGKRVYLHEGHLAPPPFASYDIIAWSPDGTRIATAGIDEKVYIWQAV